MRLRVITWPQNNRRAAQFGCTVQGYVPNIELLLLLYHQVRDSDTVSQFRILARGEPNWFPLNGWGEINFTWVDVESVIKKSALYCLGRPKQENTMRQNILRTLPPKSDVIGYSPPLAGLSLESDCPGPPTITSSSILQGLTVGDRVTIECTLAATTNETPLKLSYLTRDSGIFVCNTMSMSAGNQSETETVSEEVECQLVTPSDQECTEVTKNVKNKKHIFLPTQCVVFRKPKSAQLYRIIRLVFTKLQYEDFDGMVFCQTIGADSMESQSNMGGIKLHSSIIQLRFRLPTQIERFFYDPDSKSWECHANSYPQASKAAIQLIETDSVWIRKSLSKYQTTIVKKDRKIAYEHLIPSTKIARTPALYHWIIRFAPRTWTLSIPNRGVLVLRCTVDHLLKDLRMDMEQAFPGLGPRSIALPVGGMRSYTCALNFPPSGSKIKRIFFHRIINHSWLHYDLLMSTVTLMIRKQDSQTSTDSTMNEMYAKPFSWLVGSKALQINCAVMHESDRLMAEFSVGPNYVSSQLG